MYYEIFVRSWYDSDGDGTGDLNGVTAKLDYEVSMGIYAYSERALAHLPREGPCQFPELVARLLAANEEVGAYRSEAAWFDIGTPGEHERAVDAFAQSPELFGA